MKMRGSAWAYVAFGVLLLIVFFTLKFGNDATVGMALLGAGGAAIIVVCIFFLGRAILRFIASVANIFRK